MESANFYDVALSDGDRKLVGEHDTLNISNYPALFEHYLKSGMSRWDLRDLFLWTAHAYPGEGF